MTTSTDVAPRAFAPGYGAMLTPQCAWAAGDLVACLSALDTERTYVNEVAKTEATILRARVLLRLQRPQSVVELLAPTLDGLSGLDACKARMLYAGGLARTGSSVQALSVLGEVEASVVALDADVSLRAEVAYYQALVYWVRRDLQPCMRYALMAERLRVGLVSVRALQLTAFVASARQHYVRALTLFRRALTAYRGCQERDGDLASNITLHIAALEAQLRSKDITGSHRSANARRVSDALLICERSVARCENAYVDALQFAHDGDVRSAMRKTDEAIRAAPTLPWRIYALVARATISSAFAERENCTDVLMQAADLALGVVWEEARGGESIALLLLAESLARVEPAKSVEIMTRYDIAVRFQDPLIANHDGDPRRIALENYVRGLVARASGDLPRAWQCLARGHQGFRANGWLWRAALALIELDATPVAATSRQPFHLELAASIVREHFPRSFVGRRLGLWRNVYTDPVATQLLPAQRQILRYALDGYSAKEIARVVGRSAKTVGNQLSLLHQAFGVDTTLQLVAACHRRGLGTPAWLDGEKPL